MNATSLAIRSNGTADCHEVLSRFDQVLCHLVCASRQPAPFRLSRVGFDFCGIARAMKRQT
ncbi:MAG: hypothetical protein ACKV19_15810 [Verrucomicrobiales bacterium]